MTEPFISTLRPSPVFALAVLLTLALAGLNGLMILLMQLQPGFMGMAHFTEHHHRIHDLTFGFLFLPAIVGILAQFRRPWENVAGQAMALIPWAALVLTLFLTSLLWQNTSVRNLAWMAPAGSTLTAAILHPTWRGFFRSFRASRISWKLLAMVVVAAVPLLIFAANNVGIQGSVPDDHAQLGHYGFMTAYAVTIVGVGLLASARPDGWRLTAWVAGILPALLGLASLVYPDISSTLGPVWAIAAIAWGVSFVVASERIRLSDPVPSPAAGDHTSYPSTPRWVQASAAIVLVLVLLVIGMFLTGTRLGGLGHTPPAGGH